MKRKEPRCYRRLLARDRERISRWLARKKKVRWIARKLKPPPDFFLGVLSTGGDCCLCAAENRGSGGRFSDRAFFGRG